jgi:hypothetical protein
MYIHFYLKIVLNLRALAAEKNVLNETARARFARWISAIFGGFPNLWLFYGFFWPLAVGFRLFCLWMMFWRVSPVRASGCVSVILFARAPFLTHLRR